MSFHRSLFSIATFIIASLGSSIKICFFSPQIPNYGLALAVAHEWAVTKTKIMPSLMHLVSHVGGAWCCDSLFGTGCGRGLTGGSEIHKCSFVVQTGLSYTVIDNPNHETKWDTVDKTLEYLDTDTLLYREEVL